MKYILFVSFLCCLRHGDIVIGKDECKDLFVWTAEEGISITEPQGPHPKVFLDVQINETFNGSQLYFITTKEVIKTYTIDNSSLPYISYEFMNRQINAFLETPLLHLPDFDVVDQMVKGVDYDGEPPNNQFSLEVSNKESCPFWPTKDMYTPENGEYVNILFHLEEELDFDVMANYTIECTIYLKDVQDPHYESQYAQVEIVVNGVPDEPPYFISTYYRGLINSSLTEGALVPVNPEIEAFDGDVPSENVTYVMEDANVEGPQYGEYFLMNSETGEIFLAKNLTQEILNLNVLPFVLTALDSHYSAVAFLELLFVTDIGTNTATQDTITTVCSTCLPCNETTNTHPLTETVTTTSTRITEYSSGSTMSEHSTTVSGSRELKFDHQTYTFQIFIGSHKVGHVHAEFIIEKETTPILYNWANFSSNVDKFIINEVTGEISAVNAELSVAEYYLIAEATSGQYVAYTEVIIEVFEPLNLGIPEIYTTLMENSISENVDPPVAVCTILASNNTNSFCITGGSPEELKDSFAINQDGEISTTKILDAEMTREIKLKIKAYEDVPNCTNDNDFTEIHRDEGVVLIYVLDLNDNPPCFDSPEKISAYPTLSSLQKVVGPVTKIKVADPDIDQNMTYSILEEDRENGGVFFIDEISGDIYSEHFACPPSGCTLSVVANDGSNKPALQKVTILELPLEEIYTLRLTSVKAAEIDEKLEYLSNESALQITSLYYNAVIGSGQLTKYYVGFNIKEELETFDVQLYAINVTDRRLVTMKELNLALGDLITEPVTKFEDASSFQVVDTSQELKAYKITVGVLAGVLGLIFIAIVSFQVYSFITRKNKKLGTRQRTSVSALGKTYPEIIPFDHNDDKSTSLATEHPEVGEANEAFEKEGSSASLSYQDKERDERISLKDITDDSSEEKLEESIEGKSGAVAEPHGSHTNHFQAESVVFPEGKNSEADKNESSIYPNIKDL